MPRMSHIRNLYFSTCAFAVAVTLGTTSDAFAQSARETSRALEEIIVTAQKREESVQSIAVSVSALDANAIEKTFARDLQDIEGMSPNLIVDPVLGNGTAAISIRGMQLNDVEKSFDPAVAVYLDGVYLATNSGALLQVWDAESVEVLRGPQGTLFGRNTVGGLIHVKRKRPTGDMNVRLTGTTGSYGKYDLAGKIDFPALLDDTLKLKASVLSQNGGGYFRNVIRNTDEGDTDFLGFNFQALYEPSEALDILVSFDYFDDNTPTRPVSSLSQDGELFCVLGLGCGQPQSNAGYHRESRTTLDQKAFVETFGVTVQANYDFNENHSLQTVFGWRDTDEDAIQEFDGVEFDLFWTERPQTLEQTSFEARWHGNWLDGAVKSVVGAYVWNSEYELNQKTTSPAFFGVPVNTGDIVSSPPSYKQKTDSIALFGQIDWNVMDDLMLSLGGRYIDEEKTACGIQRLELLNIGVVPVASYGADGFAFCDSADPYYVADSVNPLTGQVVPQTGKASWSKFTPRISATYSFDQGIAFVTYSEGFRSGGFNGRSTNAFSLGPYDPEKVKSIEFGFKTQWMDNKLQFNAVGFFTDYSNKQEDVVFPDLVQVTVTVVQNAAAAQINGAEFELAAVPLPGLTLKASLGLLDASFDNWTVPDLFGNAVDKSNFELRRAPDMTIALNALYEYEMPNGNFIVFTADYSWRDDYYVTANTFTAPNFSPFTLTGGRQLFEPGLNEAYGILDVSLSYETKNWRVSVFGKNITGSDYLLHALDVGAGYIATSASDPSPIYTQGLWTFGTMNPPATWGAEIDVKF